MEANASTDRTVTDAGATAARNAWHRSTGALADNSRAADRPRHQARCTPTRRSDVYGWRARIAVILPADNAVTEPELYQLAAPGVTYHTLRLTETNAASMRNQAAHLAGAATELGADLVVYACAETSFNDGAGTHTRLSELIARQCELPVITATGAMIDAARWLGASRVCLVTPYQSESGTLLERALGDSGIEVVNAVHRDFRAESDDPREWYLTNRQPASVSYVMARSVAAHDADAVMISATNFSTFDVLDLIEQDLGVPVISSNQAIYWSAMAHLASPLPVPGYGRLLRWER